MLSSSLGAQLSVDCCTSKPPKLTFPVNQFVQKSFFVKLKPSPFPSSILSDLKISRNTSQLSAAAEAIAAAETSADDYPPPESEKLGVLVKLIEKPRIVLKFIWMEKNIGLALDQVIPGHGSIPLSPYYFWPRKDAWEELKIMLESRPWISQEQIVLLLNQATDIINLWQQSGGDL